MFCWVSFAGYGVIVGVEGLLEVFLGFVGLGNLSLDF